MFVIDSIILENIDRNVTRLKKQRQRRRERQ
jgi:hypothetical protein